MAPKEPAGKRVALPEPPSVPAAAVGISNENTTSSGDGMHFARAFDVSTFRPGNLHTHKNRSDGDSDPVEVYTWYREHGYDFVSVTDHNTFTDPADYKSIQGRRFLIIGGEEVTMLGAGRQVHVNALCTDHRLPGGRFLTARRALAFGVGEIREAGGVALVNHPNFTWGIRPSDLAATTGTGLLEINSGHPSVHHTRQPLASIT